MSVKENEAKVT